MTPQPKPTRAPKAPHPNSYTTYGAWLAANAAYRRALGKIERKAPPKRTTRPRKARRTTLAGLLRRLWTLVAGFTKETHGNTCFTCGAAGLSGSNLHAGHFVNAGKSAAVRYHPDNLRPQCGQCNVWRSGNGAEYAIRLLDQIGEAKFRRLLALSRERRSWRAPEVRELITAAERGALDYELFYMERYSVPAAR